MSPGWCRSRLKYGFGGKDGAAADISQRTLHDVYLRPWREFFEAGGRGAMLAHNAINDVPSHSSAELMGLLRQYGPSPGVLLASDMCDVGLLAHPNDKSAGFGMAASLEDAGALSMTAGMDQELCNPVDSRGQSFTRITEAISHGKMAAAALDRAASNVLRAKFASGLFDRPFANTSAAALAQIQSKENVQLALDVATEGIVLLKNDRAVLPMKLSSTTRILVVGPLAGCPNDGTPGATCDALHAYAGGYTNYGAHITSVLVRRMLPLPNTRTRSKVFAALRLPWPWQPCFSPPLLSHTLTVRVSH